MPAASANGSAAPLGPSDLPYYREALKGDFAYLEGTLPLTVCRGKSPAPMGEGWQNLRLTYDDGERLIDSTNFPAIGVMLGPGGAIDFDIDGPEELAAFLDLFDNEPPVLAAYTSGRDGGEHRLAAFDDRLLAINKATVKYKTESGKSVTVRIGCKLQKDGSRSGAQSIIPPSYHCELTDDGWRWTGRQYKWKPSLTLEEVGLPPLPDSVIEKLLAAANPSQRIDEPQQPLGEEPAEYGPGNRHDRLTSLAGSLRKRGCTFDTILAAIRVENETKCKPPKPESELIDIARYYHEAEADAPRPPKPSSKITYTRITSRELGTGDYQVNYLIKDVLVEGQPLIAGGRQKTLKTSILIDAGVSLAMAKPFLGKFEVPTACRFAMMTGESGLATIQETARRICCAKSIHLEECDNLIWSPDLPKFGRPEHADALRAFLQDDEIAVLAIDPAYLCMPGGDAGNVFAQGALLGSISEVCQSVGVTMILAHHLKGNTGRDKHDPPELEDLAWAGFQEYARQWWLLGRRETYTPGTGEHKLWLNIGGSAGHSSQWAVDVSEGVRSELSERHWQVELSLPSEVRAEATDRREQAKQEREAAKLAKQIEADRAAVVTAMTKLKKRETQKEIAAVARISGARAKAAIVDLLEDGSIREGEPLKKANHQTYPTYELNNDAE